MDVNPYSRFVAAIRRENAEKTNTGETEHAGAGAEPVKMRLGTVTQRVPLKIRVAGIEMPTEVFRIDERLTKGARQKARIESPKGSFDCLSGRLSGPVSCPGGQGSPKLSSVDDGSLKSSDAVMDESVVEQLEIDLEVNDQVLLLTTDDQLFYVVMKVVAAV